MRSQYGYILSDSRQDVSLQHIEVLFPELIVVPAREDGNHLEFREDSNELPASAFRTIRRKNSITHAIGPQAPLIPVLVMLEKGGEEYLAQK